MKQKTDQHILWRNISRVAIKNKAEKSRFALVGILNTAIDFGLFLGLSSSLSPIFANYLSTSAAFSFSFFANKKYTFRNSTSNLRKQIILFLIFTLIGLWVLQPLIIAGCMGVLDSTSLDHTIALTISKLLATAVSLTWNYITYSKYVFKNTEDTIHNIKE